MITGGIGVLSLFRKVIMYSVVFLNHCRSSAFPLHKPVCIISGFERFNKKNVCSVDPTVGAMRRRQTGLLACCFQRLQVRT